jgi:hypothetical protein
MQEILPLEGIKFGFHPLIAGSMAFEPNGCGGHKMKVKTNGLYAVLPPN